MTTTDATPERVAADLRDQREALGLTRAVVAGRAGCSLSTVAALETGYVPKRSDALDRVRAVLDAAA